jgi:hypothetical protein
MSHGRVTAIAVLIAASLAAASPAAEWSTTARPKGRIGKSAGLLIAGAAKAVGAVVAAVQAGAPAPGTNGPFPPGRRCTPDPRPGCQPSPKR